MEFNPNNANVTVTHQQAEELINAGVRFSYHAGIFYGDVNDTSHKLAWDINQNYVFKLSNATNTLSISDEKIRELMILPCEESRMLHLNNS